MEDQLPAWRRPAPVTLPVRLDPTGRRGPTRSAARGSRWRRTSHGFYVPAAVDGTLPEQRVAEAVPLLIPGGVVTGWGALRMLGAGFLDGRCADGVSLLPITLTQGRHAPTGSTSVGIRHRHDHVGSWLDVGGIRLHTAPRALVDEMRLAPDLEHAVVCADAARAARLVTCAEVEETLAALRGWQGIALARTAWSLSSGDVKSPSGDSPASAVSRRRASTDPGQRPGVRRGEVGSSAVPTCSTSRPGWSWSTTEPTTGRSLVSAATTCVTRASGRTGSSLSG